MDTGDAGCDYDLKNEHGKAAADPMDFFIATSAPRPWKRRYRENNQHVLVSNDRGVVMKSIKEATAIGIVLQDIMRILKRNDWENNKNRPEIKPYYLIKLISE